MNNGLSAQRNVVIRPRRGLWMNFVKVCTWIIPTFMLQVFGLKSPEMRSAWREKVVLCWVIIFFCLVLACITYGMSMFVCKPDMVFTPENVGKMRGPDNPWVIARGKILEVSPEDSLADNSGKVVSSMFKVDAPSCLEAFNNGIVPNGMYDMSEYAEVGNVQYTWASILREKLMVIGTSVYSTENASLPATLSVLKGAVDATQISESIPETELKCFKESCYAGELALKSTQCQISDAFLYIGCVTILSIVLVRFFLAVVYSLVSRAQTWNLMRSQVDTMPVILMTACYSEGLSELKSTLDSLCIQEYDMKLIVVISDGNITGDGNEASTPEILKSMIRPAPEASGIDNSNSPQQYISIAAGAAKINHAEVHAGTYTARTKQGREITTNIILILKSENRGKRDSQMIIMNFFHRILYKDRLTQLDQDLYRKIRHISGINPDAYGAILMVDADTSVRPGALRIMARTMQNDDSIMGICGETLISNQFGSWVTAIQVFEYYASHHLTKGFESVFGTVTCLPGCFCMYKIKLEREGGCTPILVSPSILHSYGSDETKTLHEKNLLLLGEDRYLTTLLLKNYPKKKLVFVPSAQCDTVVPDKFSVLLSQRRRWINSTIHNLFELLRVDLCGTFCCSMQFVVGLELFGTLVLPAAIVFTIVLLVSSILYEPVWIPLVLLVAILGLPAGLIFFTNLNIFYFFWLVIYLVSLPIWNLVLPMYAFWHFDDFSWGETRKINTKESQNVHDHNAEEVPEESEAKALLTAFEDFDHTGQN
ncbi:chitin synthase [Nematocida sp. AWRm80]|nr:chitin synthase [Nematocida sp. AWRm80]